MHVPSPERKTYYDHYERDAQGNLIVSENNREKDIAFFFYKADDILREASVFIESSLLSEQLQQKAFTLLNQELSKLKEEASSKARSDRDKHQIRYGVIYAFETVRRNLKEEGNEEMEKEWKAVQYAIAESILHMTQGDVIFSFLQEQIRKHQEKKKR